MIKIELMSKYHVSQIAALEKRCFSDPWSENSISYELTNPLSVWLVALDKEKVLGYIGSQAVLDSADMMNLAVDPDFRKQGIGRSLVDALEKHLVPKGVTMLLLEVRVSNEPARALYETLGFSYVGKRTGYYSNPKEDAMIMRKELHHEDPCN